MKPHPDERINQALITLLDAITENNRANMSSSVLFFYHNEYKLRVMDGKPLPEDCKYTDNDILAIAFGG